MERFSTSLLAFGLLAGCAAAPPPPMTADNPANPSAPEATVRPLHNTLGTDSLTRKGNRWWANSGTGAVAGDHGSGRGWPNPNRRVHRG
jgi:hypothetical protein